MFLLSDGLAVNVSGVDPADRKIDPSRIVSRSTKKIGKISDSIGFMWTGSFSGSAREVEKKCTAKTAEQAAEQIRDALVPHSVKLLNEPWFMVNIHLFQATSEGFRYFQVTKQNKSLVVNDAGTIPAGHYGASVPFMKGCSKIWENFVERVAVENGGLATPSNIRKAYDQFIQHYQTQGATIGGQIYMEILTL